MHECTIGMLLELEDSKLITLNELKEHINETNEFRKGNINILKIINPKGNFKQLSLNDYKDKRKSNDLYRFCYCPYCGDKIDWKILE